MDSFRLFLAQNREYLRFAFKGLGYGSVSLAAGFVLFYLVNRKKIAGGEELSKDQGLRTIPSEQLEKLVTKIKNTVVHTLMIMYDQKHVYDPNEFVDPDEDVEITDLQADDDLTILNSQENSGEFVRQESNISERNNLSRSSSMRQSETRTQYERRDIRKSLDNRNFSNF